MIIVTLFPMGIGAAPGILQTSASGVIWVAALLASLLSLDHLFRSDFEDGALEQPLMSPHPLFVSGYHPTPWAIAAALRISLD